MPRQQTNLNEGGVKGLIIDMAKPSEGYDIVLLYLHKWKYAAFRIGY